MNIGKLIKVRGGLYKGFLPVIAELIESGAMATVLMAYDIPQKYIATLILVKGAVKTYLLRNATMNEENDSTLVSSNAEDTTQTGTLTLDDRVDWLIDYINELIKSNCKHPGFKKETIKPHVVNILTKPEEEIAREALAKLTPLQRKVLKV